MNLKKNITVATGFFMEPQNFIQKKKYIFFISHMRSYSTLICHILGSHPEITGYSEIHQSYEWKIDFLKAKGRIYLECDDLKGRYLLDKILHNCYRISDNVLSLGNVNVIVSIREPEKTIKSIVSHERKLNSRKYSSPEEASEYYLKRLKHIISIASKIKNKFLFFNAEMITDETENLLNVLTKFLNLKSPLSREYKQFKSTGIPIRGDSSEFIKQGHICRDRENHDEVTISKVLLNKLNQAYHQSSAILIDLSKSVNR